MERQGIAVCRDCMSALRRSGSRNPSRTAQAQQWTRRSFITARQLLGEDKRATLQQQERSQIQRTRPNSSSTAARTSTSLGASDTRDLSTTHARINELTTSALRPDDGKLPAEQRILYVLEQLDALASSLSDATTIHSAKKQRDQPGSTATSALLGSVNARQNTPSLTKPALLNLISQHAEEILRHPHVFITPAVLKAYVDLQALLHQPASFPEVFELYATKPTPKETAKGIDFIPVKSNAANTAIDPETANAALAAATDSKNLPLSIAIINTTFSTPSFRTSKLLRRALLPSTLLLTAPLAAYTLSTQLSHLQTTMTPEYATGVAFAGIMTYTAVVGSLGYIVITTSNDQMERVTWAKGVPLWERWVREEERAALDVVAQGWGFAEVGKRGDEEGGEWEGLREEVGLRGMVLDRVELMEGME